MKTNGTGIISASETPLIKREEKNARNPSLCPGSVRLINFVSQKRRLTDLNQFIDSF